LGKDTVALSEDHKKEIMKAEQARLAKIALDKQRELEENSKSVITSLPSSGDLLVDDAYLNGKKVVCLKDIKGPGTVTLRTNKPLIKVFVDDCTEGVRLVLDSQGEEEITIMIPVSFSNSYIHHTLANPTAPPSPQSSPVTLRSIRRPPSPWTSIKPSAPSSST